MSILAKLRRRAYRGSRGVGQRWEDLAEEVLKAEGYVIRERNYRTRSGEIDFIAEDNGVVCFIEVKGRSGPRFGTPEEAVTDRKQRRIARAAEEYAHRNRIRSAPCRFDVVGIRSPGHGKPEVTVFRDAFPAPDSGRV